MSATATSHRLMVPESRAIANALTVYASRWVPRRHEVRHDPPPVIHIGYRNALRSLAAKTWEARLEAIRSLAVVADEEPQLRQRCIDTLCAYLRAPRAQSGLARDGEELRLRRAIVQIITRRLQPGATHSWRGFDLDFSGAVFENGSFAGAHFVGGKVSFAGARFIGEQVSFSNAVFACNVDFGCAQFAAKTVDFSCATFAGGNVDFAGAQLADGTLDFYAARFAGGLLSFAHATFTAGTLDFYAARFNGSDVRFTGTHFAGASVRFASALFAAGKVTFHQALFVSGEVDFAHAHFNRSKISFRKAYFIGGLIDLSRPFSYVRPPVFDRVASNHVRLPL